MLYLLEELTYGAQQMVLILTVILLRLEAILKDQTMAMGIGIFTANIILTNMIFCFCHQTITLF